MTTPTTAALVDALDRRAEDVPDSALDAARTLVLDFLGVAVAGASTEEGRRVHHVLAGLGRQGPSSVPRGRRGFDPATAALITGTMGYSIGLTDTHALSITHPGPSVIAAALAQAEAGDSSGRELLTAVVLGVEAVVRIGAVVNPSHRARGFHPTATCNPFGAAVAAGHLLGAGRRELTWALGLAGSTAGGLYEFRREGSMLMALHGGWPAHSGVTVAHLAHAGFTGPGTVLEGDEGFFRAFADTTHPELLVPPDDAPYGIEEVSLRPYCACRYAHAGIDALQRVRAAHDPFGPADIERLTVYTHRTAVEQESEPDTVVGARLSTRFNMALAAVHGPRLSEVSTGDLADPAVTAVAQRTEVVEDPELTALFPRQWACRVRVDLRDGRSYEERVDTPKGEPENPMTPTEVRDKFLRLTVPAVGEDRAHALLTAVGSLPEAPRVRPLLAALATGDAP
ncbi:MmgE/PrpD family protein [Streptomyces sp. NPDC050560]|uniref:MmgE/PrpD family protein n=1 Tax=Streptomyces sp. NPDC050560 TaxID=3365630 RepID=UPI0037A809CE